MTTARKEGDAARVTVLVEVAPEDAFAVFTEEIDLWWRRGPKYRNGGKLPSKLWFERKLGGRLFETIEGHRGEHLIEIGRVTAWDPPSRLVLEWRIVNFAPDERTEVEVTFAPSPSGTRVTLEHRGWAALRPDHPARHGNVGAAMSRMIGLFWGELLGAMREYVAEERPPMP